MHDRAYQLSTSIKYSFKRRKNSISHFNVTIKKKKKKSANISTTKASIKKLVLHRQKTETCISWNLYPTLVLQPGNKPKPKQKNENQMTIFWEKRSKSKLKGQKKTNYFPAFRRYSSSGRCSALFILKSAVWIIRILEKTCKTKQDCIDHFLTSIT